MRPPTGRHAACIARWGEAPADFLQSAWETLIVCLNYKAFSKFVTAALIRMHPLRARLYPLF